MRFVHAADLHIDSPLLGLTRYEGAPLERVRGSTRRATENLVTLCIERDADLLVLAGDLFDGDWKDYSTGLFFIREMNRLKSAGVRVVSVRGNHDAANHISKHLELPDNVTELSSEAPQTLNIEELGLAVHGQSYGRRAETAELARNYPAAVPGVFNLALLHTCATGRAGHEPYAPCSLELLLSKGYDYWALGHVHEREVLHEDPWVVFPGNTQGRHAKECGPKGASVVDVADGRVTQVEHVELDVVRWHRLEVTASPDADAFGIVEQLVAELERAKLASGPRVVAARLELLGETNAHGELAHEPERWEAELRARATVLSGVWIERVKFRTRPLLQRAELTERQDVLGQVARAFAELEQDAGARSDSFAFLSELRAKLPPGLNAVSEADQAGIVEEAERVVLSRLARLTEDT